MRHNFILRKGTILLQTSQSSPIPVSRKCSTRYIRVTNTEARSFNPCCRRKGKTYSEYVYIALVTLHAQCVGHVSLCSLSTLQ
jgi:hypothetical protein